MAKDIPWEIYRSFLSVLQEGSLSGAARALGLTQPTVGRHMDALEAAFGQTLFTRAQHGVIPTETALSLRHYAELMHNTAAAMQRAATRQSSASIAGTVRISVPESIGLEVLPQALSHLCLEHPDLRIELVPTDKVQDIVQREADIAVRMLAPQQDMLVARRVGQLEMGLFAHRRYLHAHGTPTTAAQLAEHCLIGFYQETPFIRKMQARFPQWRRESFRWRTDSAAAQLALIRAGAGIGGCQLALAARSPDLIRVLPEQVSYTLECWITMHEALRHTPRCRLVFDALVQCLQDHIRF